MLKPGKRAKGFAIKLTLAHITTVHAIYPWLRQNGFTNEGTDAALAALPPPPPFEAIKQGCCHTAPYIVRIRAEHAADTAALLDITELVTKGAVNFACRADHLRQIDVHDLLVDAGR